jgi:hypothetical protein
MKAGLHLSREKLYSLLTFLPMVFLCEMERKSSQMVNFGAKWSFLEAQIKEERPEKGIIAEWSSLVDSLGRWIRADGSSFLAGCWKNSVLWPKARERVAKKVLLTSGLLPPSIPVFGFWMLPSIGACKRGFASRNSGKGASGRSRGSSQC